MATLSHKSSAVCQPSLRAGFTLIELLVVIAVIAIRCTGTLRQLGLAVSLYSITTMSVHRRIKFGSGTSQA